MMKTIIKKRVDALRALMHEYGLAAYYVPGTDPHMSEYIPAHWQRRAWISGFTGSNGDVVITTEQAGLWTDGRYFLQAEAELEGTGITLFKQGVKGELAIPDWLCKTLKRGEVAGVDPRLLSCQKAHELSEVLERSELGVSWLEENLIDRLWVDRPPLPELPLVPHPVTYAGESVLAKLTRVRNKMRAEAAQFYVLDTLDAIAWLFNIRGSDIEYNPVVIAYAFITLDTACLFVRPGILTPAAVEYLAPFASVKDYADFQDELQAAVSRGTKVWLDAATSNYWIETLLLDKCEILDKEDPVISLKAVKNTREIAGFKQAHIRDGVAMVKWLAWLERSLQTAELTELSAQEQLLKFRQEQDLFQFPSFATIAAYGPHGAIIHYNSTPATNTALQKTGLFLIDSGGQYLDGTTDITRTVACGQVTREEQTYYTLVLKGYIQLATASFPEGTRGQGRDLQAFKSAEIGPTMICRMSGILPMSFVTQARINRSPVGSVSARCVKSNGNTISSHSEPRPRNRLVAASNGRAGLRRPVTARIIGATRDSRTGPYRQTISSVPNLAVKKPEFTDW
jgi:Xaa-Pro aminopeptidase